MTLDLDITTVYDGTYLNGKRVLITGAEQNLGLETLKEVVVQGGQAIAVGRTSSDDLDAFKAANPDAVQIITGIDVTDDAAMGKMVTEMEGKAVGKASVVDSPDCGLGLMKRSCFEAYMSAPLPLAALFLSLCHSPRSSVPLR